MDKIFEYSIESAIALAILYFFYWVVLRRDTHFRNNRLVLMFSVITAMILPAVAGITSIPSASPISFAIDFSQQGVTPSAAQIEPSAPNAGMSSWEILGLIYVAGALIVLARLAYQAVYLHAVSRLSKISDHDGFKIISLDTDMVPFSYFNRIFIPAQLISKDSLESVIAHEKLHLSQGHYIDLFIVQIITVFQWFNPFIWMLEKSLKEVHEYLADESVLESGKNMGEYQAILVNEAFGGPVFILTNQLNKSLIKKRILMMKNVKTPKIAQLKALLLVPLIAALLLAFANPPLISQSGGDGITIKGNVSDRFSGTPIPGANLIIKGTTIGTITDLKGNYQIIVNNAQDVLIVSVSGYRTQELPLDKNTKINVLMEPDIIAIDFSKENKLEIFEKPAANHNTQPGSGGGFIFVEEMPAYPGGTIALHEFIHNNLNYPYEPKQAGLEGTVLVSYIIDVNGEISNPKVIRGIQQDLDAEALRVTKLIKGWKPATQGGRPVPTTVTMPIEFKIN